MQASLDPTPPCFFPLSSLTPLSPPIATTASVYVFKWNVESFENIIFISIQFGHTTTGNDGKAAYRFGASGLKPFTSQGMAPLIPFGIISQAYLLSSVFPHILELSSLKILQFCHPSSFTSLVLFVLESSVPFSANSRLLIRWVSTDALFFFFLWELSNPGEDLSLWVWRIDLIREGKLNNSI